MFYIFTHQTQTLLLSPTNANAAQLHSCSHLSCSCRGVASDPWRHHSVTIVCTQRSCRGGEKKSQRRGRKQQEKKRSHEDRIGAVGILPLSFSQRLPVVTAPISFPRGTPQFLCSHIPQFSPFVCVYFPLLVY